MSILEGFKRAKSVLEDYPESWPPKEYFMHESKITKSQIDELKSLINDNAGERDVDSFITRNPVVLTIPLDFASTGHHGAWIIPKRSIRSKISNDTPGLIPDFIVGGRNSGGFTWMIVELKGINTSLFTTSHNKVYFSSEANRGICQLLEYIDFCSKSQAHIRDILKLKDFREPNGFLIIGKEDEFRDSRKKELKAAWNRSIKNTIYIKSYDALLRSCTRIYDSFNRT